MHKEIDCNSYLITNKMKYCILPWSSRHRATLYINFAAKAMRSRMFFLYSFTEKVNRIWCEMKYRNILCVRTFQRILINLNYTIYIYYMYILSVLVTYLYTRKLLCAFCNFSRIPFSSNISISY